MKKLNTIFSFVLLSFCLFINVSYGVEIVANELYQSNSSAFTYSSSSGSLTLEGYTPLNIAGAVKEYIVNGDDTVLKTILDDLSAKGYSKSAIYITMNGEVPRYCIDFFPDEFEFDFTYTASNPSGVLDYFGIYAPADSYYYHFYQDRNSYLGSTRTQITDSYAYIYNAFYTPGPDTTNHFIEFNNISVKTMTKSSGYYIWDGETYYYKAPSSDEPDTPTMPTNSEIASAVQMFYNSVYNLPNIAFDDFLVLYDNTTGLYTYIGHTLESALGQVIVEPNGYYEGYKYNVQWWKFFIDDTNDNWLDKYSNYYVYTSDGTIDNLKYIGDSNISGLIEKSGPWATSNTVIVYSTNDYPVKYVTFSEDSPDPDIQTGIIQGDQYTYDENLDITDNQYNPLDNFISIDYPSTLVGNADFDSFLNTFNENKDVLILPQNANWVILANNSLFSHFSSFIIMCTLFIILQRVMRG